MLMHGVMFCLREEREEACGELVRVAVWRANDAARCAMMRAAHIMRALQAHEAPRKRGIWS